MNFMIRFALFALLLCAPAWGQFVDGDKLTDVAATKTSCASPCDFDTGGGALVINITAGQNRNLFCHFGFRRSSDLDPVVSIGGTAMTLVGTKTHFAATIGASDWRMLESDLAALGTGNKAITVTTSEDASRASIAWFSLAERLAGRGGRHRDGNRNGYNDHLCG